MIKINIENREHLPEKKLYCPRCDKLNAYYNYSPLACEQCGYVFGNISRLIADIRVRKYYHREGAID